jgi:uncharacterized protein (PEP-CTERM system associated)
LRCLAALLALHCAASRADKTEVHPFLSVAQTYTNNVTLAPQGSEVSDVVTQVLPGISIAFTGARLRFNALYAPEILKYSKLDRAETVFQRGKADASLELVRKLLFVEAGAKIDQYELSLRGPVIRNLVNATSNQATAKTSYISPYILRDLGAAARAEARISFSTLRTDDQSVANSDARRVDLRLTSGPMYKQLTWGFDYEREIIEYEPAQDTRSEKLQTRARLLIAPTVGMLAQLGRERYGSGGTAPDVTGSLRRAGLDWTPTPRTYLAVTAGRRFDEDSYSLEFRHRTRLTTWRTSYSEDVTSSRTQLFLAGNSSTAGALDPLFVANYPDPIERQRAVEEFIARAGLPSNLATAANFFSEQLFLQKRWQASVGIEGVRNTVLASAFWETRNVLFSSLGLPVGGDFANTDSIRLSGASLAWSWHITPRITWNMEASRARSIFLDLDRVDDYTALYVGFTRQFQPRLSGALLFRRQEKESTQALNTYVERAATVSLRMNF